MIQQPIRFIRPDICPYCKSQKIELLSFNGYPQHYSDCVTDYLRGKAVIFNKYEIRSMKCKACNKEFIIDWSSGFPKPLLDNNKLNYFIYEFLNKC